MTFTPKYTSPNALSLKAAADAEQAEGRGAKGVMADAVSSARAAGSAIGGAAKPKYLSALKALVAKRTAPKVAGPKLAYGAKSVKR